MHRYSSNVVASSICRRYVLVLFIVALVVLKPVHMAVYLECYMIAPHAVKSPRACCGELPAVVL
jgi:hypothetical protein